MSYITPVTDRTITDILNKTSKAYWNVADWARVYNNARLVASLAAIELGEDITFNTLTAPTITTIPNATDFNSFLSNIENVRLAVASESITGTETEIKDDWQAGQSVDAPDYQDANLWESTLHAIWTHYNGASLPVCPILSSNLTIATDTQYVVADCIDLNSYSIDIQGTGALIIL